MSVKGKGKKQHGLGWTKKEIDYLQYHLGFKPLEEIAAKLKRTVEAVESKMQKMNLSIRSVQIDKNSVVLHQLSLILQTDSKVIKNWVTKYEFPLYELNISKTGKSGHGHYYVDVEDFWLWANSNRHVVDWTKLERRTLLPEPEWLDEALRETLNKSLQNRRKIWTKQEDVLVWSMYYHEGLTMKVIAKKLGRTAVSIEKRLKRLRENGFAKEMSHHAPSNKPQYMKIEEEYASTPKPKKATLKKWTIKEEKQLIYLFYHCNWSYKALAVELDRTENSIERKLTTLRKAGHVTEEDLNARVQNNWTEEEENRLIHLFYHRNLSYKDIAVKLKRTENAVENKMGYLREVGRVTVDDINARIQNDWTEEEEKRVIQLYYHGNWSIKAIAVELGRTENSIGRKLDSLRKIGRVTEEDEIARNKNDWTEEEEKRLIHLFYHGNLSYKAIAVELNRTEHAVNRRLVSLRKAGRVSEADLNARVRNKWTEEAENRLIYLFYHCNWSYKAIALDLKRTESAVKRKLTYLREAGRISEEDVSRQSQQTLSEDERTIKVG